MSGSRIAPALPSPGEGGAVAGGELPGDASARPDGGQGASLNCPEVRDVLAWMRLLVDPRDAAAVVRALSRPPIELRQVELARVIQVARRRTLRGTGKLDLVLGLSAATESPQVPPEARERIQRFVELHRSAASQLDTAAPDVLLAWLIQQLGVRAGALPASRGTAEQRAGLELLHGLAVEFVRATPDASTQDLTRHLTTVVPDGRVSIADEPADELHAMFQLLSEEVIEGVARIGGRLGELRLDTELDISHGVVRYLELLKLAALMQRPEAQDLADALADVNARLLAAATPLQREIFQTSTLDDTLVRGSEGHGETGDAGVGARARARAVAPREQHSLDPFLPRKGHGLALSASDIQTYRSCPLRYKYARVLRIPTEQTVHQRFGIVVHQVLERYHADDARTLAQMLALLDACWRRAGFGDGEQDRELFGKAQAALVRYHERLGEEHSEPVWFERQFSFRVGPHHLRGRVDRVDRVGGVGGGHLASGHDPVARGGAPDEPDEPRFELIDYKTSRPKSSEQLQDDIQLSLYALAAREDWGLQSAHLAYYYVLDDLKVPVTRGEQDAEWVKGVVLGVGERILSQEFEPIPSHQACSMCDYRIVCPVAEA